MGAKCVDSFRDRFARIDYAHTQSPIATRSIRPVRTHERDWRLTTWELRTEDWGPLLMSESRFGTRNAPNRNGGDTHHREPRTCLTWTWFSTVVLSPLPRFGMLHVPNLALSTTDWGLKLPAGRETRDDKDETKRDMRSVRVHSTYRLCTYNIIIFPRFVMDFCFVF